MRSQSKKENCGENEDNGGMPPSTLIDSLRTRISKVSALNRFRFINSSKGPPDSEQELQMSDIADKIRNQISLSKSSKLPEPIPANGGYSKTNEDAHSPLKKKNKCPEKLLLQDMISNFGQGRSELENILLYNINKLRHEHIKQRNHLLPKSENDAFFPNSYTPLSSMKFMNIQELYLFLSLFYQNYREKIPNPAGARSKMNKLQILFFAPENTSSLNSSTIVTGRHTENLHEDYLFSNDAPASKLILNSSKWQTVSRIIETDNLQNDISTAVFILVNPTIIQSTEFSFISPGLFFICNFAHLLTCLVSK